MLIVEFAQYHSILCGRVLAMSEDLRGKSPLHECDHNGKIFRIVSDAAPNLVNRTLHVRGADNLSDEASFCWNYLSPEEANEAKAVFSKMIRELNIENCYSCQPEIVGG